MRGGQAICEWKYMCFQLFSTIKVNHVAKIMQSAYFWVIFHLKHKKSPFFAVLTWFLIRISLVFWATELDMSLSCSICQPSSVYRYRARGLSLFRGDKVKIVIELDDLSSSVTYRARFFKRRKKEKKLEIKAIMTTWSTKSKTPSRSQFLTDKKHCVAGRLKLFWRRVF